MALYKVTFEFLNGNGEWKPDFLDNNGKGFSLKDATDVAWGIQLDEVCEKRNVKVELMNETKECILVRDSREWKKLEWIAASLELESKHNAKYKVEDVYLDYGADWMWTTIVRYGYRECQILSPRQWHMIMDAETLADLIKALDNIQHGEYFND